ncbi:hypothetical protein QI060_05290 [Staphylococcus saprophyticus]|uniref:hypothetical protein n=1 Tax=Staphylococcus saprophyticus TaxID=29385 RepID=UPI00076AF65E|nr:hypothetical protein [Staphylococcus saprophyticus]MDW3862785.1 hypothetical protein [Staphylococcus saprophyticus]MDW3910201.1 hypothetical protein [Staphylococcus saprophyticus]MDW3915338.1 hypothetical protein [Staphylococcus saprophyticus]MDW3925118.1 hypothetical protein [Staphylococcus saprophyticus]MDW3962786.1 hypothetical protein [Staphylococcus saprophyticus]
MLQDVVYKVLLSIREENSVDFKTLDVSEKTFLLALESVAREDLAQNIELFYNKCFPICGTTRYAELTEKGHKKISEFQIEYKYS